MTPEEARKFAIEIASKMFQGSGADHLIVEAKKIESYLLGKS